MTKYCMWRKQAAFISFIPDFECNACSHGRGKKEYFEMQTQGDKKHFWIKLSWQDTCTVDSMSIAMFKVAKASASQHYRKVSSSTYNVSSSDSAVMSVSTISKGQSFGAAVITS